MLQLSQGEEKYKQTLHISGGQNHILDQMTPSEEHWLLDHCDEQRGRGNPHQHLTSNDMYPQQCMAINSSVCSHFLMFALITTTAFSRSIGKLRWQITFSIYAEAN